MTTTHDKTPSPCLAARLRVSKGPTWPLTIEILPRERQQLNPRCDFCSGPMLPIPDGWICSRCETQEMTR